MAQCGVPRTNCAADAQAGSRQCPHSSLIVQECVQMLLVLLNNNSDVLINSEVIMLLMHVSVVCFVVPCNHTYPNWFGAPIAVLTTNRDIR